MSKGTEAFNNILAEGEFRYFSSLYDRDMFREDVITVKKELEAFEIIKAIIEQFPLTFTAMINQSDISSANKDYLKEVIK